MNQFDFTFHGAQLRALPSGALFWPSENLLIVSDLHFGKSARLSAVGGGQLPPYDTRDTLFKLQEDLANTKASKIICLGDSFDSPDIEAVLPEHERLWITRLQAGRDWIWIEGNHDPGPVSLGGAHMAEVVVGSLVLRHIAVPQVNGEISGHYHPKAVLNLKGRRLSRPCFLRDSQRLILPAYGSFTGGLRSDHAVLSDLMQPRAEAILTGPRMCAIPMPRSTT